MLFFGDNLPKPSPHSFTVAIRGLLTPDKRSSSTGSASAAFGVSSRSNGRTESPTPRSLDEPTCLASLHYHPKTPTVVRPRQVLYGELQEGARYKGPPLLRFKDVCKRDLRTRSNQSQHLGGQVLAPDCDAWHHGVMEGALRAKATIKRAARKKDKHQFERPPTTSVPSAIKTATQESGF